MADIETTPEAVDLGNNPTPCCSTCVCEYPHRSRPLPTEEGYTE